MKELKASRIFTIAAAFALAVCMSVSLSSCGSKTTEATQADAGSAEEVAEMITVNLHIDGSLGEEGAQSDQVVTLAPGSSALDALEASNAQVTSEESDYGPYVTIINGIGAHDSYGWVYDVNGEEVTVGASDYELSDGDTVNWTFIQYE